MHNPMPRTVLAPVAALSLCSLALAQGGDTPATATPIPALPFAETGTTIGFADDHDETCPYTGSTSPDVFYSYAGTGETIAIDLCDSGYDTKTFVYDEALALVATVNGAPACNDDFCSSPNGGNFRSYLACVPADGLVYIAVDGWLGDAGAYSISIVEQDPDLGCPPEPPCIVECAFFDIEEDEPCRYGEPNPVDDLNGGCGADPPVFMSIGCGAVVCGTSYDDGTSHDTDWFEIDTRCPGDTCSGGSAGGTFFVSGQAEFASIFGRIDNDGIADCDGVTGLAEFATSAPCEPIDFFTLRFGQGVYWFFVAPDLSQIVDCNQPSGGPPNEIGARYVLSVQCEPHGFPCVWDVNQDGKVGFGDLVVLLSNWGPCRSPCYGDINVDGVVDLDDLLALLSFWDYCCQWCA